MRMSQLGDSVIPSMRVKPHEAVKASARCFLDPPRESIMFFDSAAEVNLYRLYRLVCYQDDQPFGLYIVWARSGRVCDVEGATYHEQVRQCSMLTMLAGCECEACIDDLLR
jgi:hypothetical protein